MRVTLLYYMYITITHGFRLFSNRIHNQFRQNYFKDRFTPVVDEHTIHVSHTNHHLSNLSGTFFAQIGSNPKHVKNGDYHWFDGDGMIHGVFFKNNSFLYQNKWIRTKRFEVENKWKRKMYLYFDELKGWNGVFQIIKFSIMEILGFLPKAKGTANTALIRWSERMFALHEGDMPYEMNINKEEEDISTLGRLNYTSIHSMTAHPVIDVKRDLIYLYGYNNYDFNYGRFIFNTFDKEMNFIGQKNISLINNGMVHDVAFTGDEIIIPDMPLKYDVSRILKEKLPLYFDKKMGITRFGIFNVSNTDDLRWYHFDNNFYIFHFSNAKKKDHTYSVFACVMEDLHMEDFIDLKALQNTDHIVRGKLRLKELIIDERMNKTRVIENIYLENLDIGFEYNLDFPIVSKEKPHCIYCSIFEAATGYIRGYIKVNTMRFALSKPEIFLFNPFTCGNSEPQPIVVDDREYLLTFTNDESRSYISLIDVSNNTIISNIVPTRIPPGFHSTLF